MFPTPKAVRLFPLVILILLSLVAAGQTATRQVLQRRMPEAVSRLGPVGRLQGAQHLKLQFELPLRNQAALTELLRKLYDPTSPDYRHYLTPGQFTAQFGPTQQDYDAVAAFATAHGLTVTKKHPNRLVLDVDGAVADIEKTFNVTMRTYEHPTEHRQFYAPDVAPTMDLQVPLSGIGGLDNYSVPHPCSYAKPQGAGNPVPASGQGPGGTFAGYDYRAAYVPGTTLTGSGQTAAVVELGGGGYYASDITAYETQFGLPNVPLINVSVDGGGGVGSGGEVPGDIEMIISMAPGLSAFYVYQSNSFIDALSRVASDDTAKSISTSWTGGGYDGEADSIFEQMAAQGQSYFNASGDGDVYGGDPPFPVCSPYVTAVGGTELSTSGSGGSYVGESVWNWGGGTGSAGGTSTYYPIPSWQQGISMVANQGSTTMRNIPDIAAAADNIYIISDNGGGGDWGGTSFATPLWAGFMALANQQAAANGRGTVGWVSAAVYPIGCSSLYGSTFHDTTSGANTPNGGAGKFQAVTGYDLCTGWGSPTGMALINALATAPDSLAVSSTSFLPVGHVGGPFTPSSGSYTLVNTGTASVTWTAVTGTNWLTLSSTAGTLAASGSTTVTATVNSNANALVAGTTSYLTPYSNAVTFTDAGTAFSQSRAVTLSATVNQVLSSVSVAPVGGITAGQTAQMSATAYDQFDALMLNQPSSYTWSLVSGSGSITTGGLYTAPGSGTLATVAATSGTVQGNGTVGVVSPPWGSQDIGGPALPGTAYDQSGVFTVTAEGSDIWSTSDQFRYVYHQLGGDGLLLARISSQQNTGNPKTGVMIRDSLAAGSRHVFTCIDPNNGVIEEQRAATNGATTDAQGPSNIAPYWVKIIRQGSVITSQASPDGVTWTTVATATNAINPAAYIGFANESGNTAAYCTGTFDHVAVLAASPISVAVNTGSSTTINLLANAVGSSGATLTVSNVTQGSHGTVVNNGDGTATYTASTGLAGSDSFVYTVGDGAGNMATATVSVNVGGLIGFWTLDDGSGATAADSTGNGFTGTLQGGATWTTGTIGGALAFDGTSGSVSIGNPGALGFTGPITISTWVRSVSTAGLQDIVSHGYALSPDGEVFLRINNGNYELGSWNGASFYTSVAIPSGDIGNWVQLTGVYDGTSWRLYHNGVLLSSAVASTGAVPVNANWGIGSSADADRYFNGSMEQVRLYDLGLSSSAVTALYNDSAPTVATAAAATPNPVGDPRTNLSVLGASVIGESNLAYTWAATSIPAGASAPSFSANGTNAAKNSVADFSSPGTYTLAVTITDVNGLYTESSVNVTVTQAQLVWTGGGGNGNWSNAANWTGSWAPQAGDQLSFNASATDDLAPGTVFTSLYLIGNNIALTGNPITLTSGTNLAIFNSGTNNSIAQSIQFGSPGTVSVASGKLTISGAISGGYGLIETGTGTLVLTSTNNSYSGGTAISSGTLQLGDGVSNSGIVIGNIADNATLVIANPASETYSGVLSGTGVVTISGTGTETLTGANTFTGVTTINAGTLRLLRPATTFSPTIVNAGGTLLFDNNGSSWGTNPLAAISLNGGALAYYSSANAWLVLTTGAVTNQTGASSTITIQAGGGGTSGFFLDGGLQGSGTVTVNNSTAGAGLDLRNNNSTFSGTLIVNGIASTTPGVGSGLGVGGCTTGLQNADIALYGTVELLNQGIGWANGASGVFQMGALSGSGAVVANYSGSGGGTTVTLGLNGHSGTFSGIIADGTGDILNLVKSGAGTQILSGANTYTGSTTVSGGTLQLGDGVSHDGSVAGNITNNATLVFANPVAQTFTGIISGTGVVTITGTGTETLAGVNTYTGTTTVSGGTLIATNTAALGTGGIINNGSLVLNSTGQNLIGATLTGNGSLTASVGDGTIGITSPVTAGLVSFTSSFGSTVQSLYGSNYAAAINLFSNVTTTGNQIYNGIVSIGRGSGDPATVLTTTGAGSSIVLADGVISGVAGYWSSGSLTLNTSAGNGNVTLGGQIDSYGVGNLTVNSGTGTITLTGGYYMYDYSVFNGSVALSGNSTFENGPSAGLGSAWVRGVTFNGNVTGAYTLTALLGNGAAGTTGTGTAGLIFNTNSTQLVSVTLSGSSGITKTGTGTTTLSVPNTYTGATAVAGGTMILSGPNASNSGLAYSSGISVGNGATLSFISDNALTGYGGFAVPITVSSGGALAEANGASAHIFGLLTLAGGALTSGSPSGSSVTYGTVDLDGGVTAGGVATTSIISAVDVALSESGGTVFTVNSGAANGIDLDVTGAFYHASGASDNGLIKEGTGVMRLDGSNSYTGATTIDGGTLSVIGSIASSAVTVNSGGTLAGTGTTGAVTVASGGVLAPGISGTGTGTLGLNNSALTLSGATVMEINASSGATSNVQGISTLTYGGSLTATNLGGSFAAGDAYSLFSAGTYAGNFSSINLPSLPTGLVWNTADLPVNGGISVSGTLPSGWSGQDIGATGIPGSSSYSNGIYTVNGSGADIQNTADAFQYVSQSLTGDGEIRAQVTSQTNSNAWAKAGVMIRSGTGAGAINALVALTPGNGFTFQYRTTASGTTAYSTTASNTAPNNWVRLTKSGTLITAYISSSGTAWTEMGTAVVSMTNSVTLGLAVTSHNNSAVSAATFANVSVTPFPSPWVSADIGSPGLQGSAEYYNSSYTLHGAGNIGGSADNYHFVYQSLSSSGTLSAQVNTLQNSGTSSRIGVMIRTSLTNNSQYAFMGVSGSGSFVSQYRSSTGGGTTTTTSSSGTAPNLWLRIVRTSNTLSAYKSTNGTSWTLVKSVSITMGSNIYIGMVDASGTTTTLNSSVFDSVTYIP